MAEAYDLMNFSELENDENQVPSCTEEPEDLPPGLLQTPVIKNSILKQSTKDNLIQLYTPVQKNKGRLKVHFGTPRVIQTPQVGNGNKTGTRHDGNKCSSICEVETPCSQPDVDEGVIDDTEERENWAERTSVLTKQDHAEYCQVAHSIVEELVLTLPFKDEEDSGILEDSAMEVTEAEDYIQDAEPAPRQNDTIDMTTLDILSQAEELLRSLRGVTGSESAETTPSKDATTSNEKAVGESETCTAESMDFEEAMEVDESIVINTDNLIKDSEADGKHELKTNSCGTDSVFVDQPTNSPKNTDESRSSKETVQRALHEHSNEADLSVSVNELRKDNTCEIVDTNKNQVDDLPAKSVQAIDEIKLPVHAGSEEKIMNDKSDIDESDSSSHPPVKNKDAPRPSGDGGNSSEEEYMSADEDMEIDERKTPNKREGNKCDVSENNGEPVSPERTPPKVEYNLNFDDLEVLDPFASKASVMNSPEIELKNGAKPKMDKKTVKKDMKNVVSQKIPVDDTSIENLKANNKITSGNDQLKEMADAVLLSPNAVLVDEVLKNKNAGDIFAEKFEGLEDNQSVVDADWVDNGNVKQQLFNDKELNDLDPFKPKTQIVNSPSIATQKVNENLNENNAEDKKSSAKTSGDTVLPSETLPAEEKHVNSITEDHIATDDTTTPQSPALPASKLGAYNLDALDLDSMDPFKPEKQFQNSPDMKNNASTHDNIDSFKPKIQIGNSPEMNKANDMDPFSPKQQTVNSSEKKIDDLDIDILDPFKPKKQVLNSPDIKTGDNDLFKPKIQLLNSPVTEHDVNQHLSKTVETELDAFQPVETEIDSVVSETELKSLTQNRKSPGCATDNNDPFKPKTQLSNSPDMTKESHDNITHEEGDDNTNAINCSLVSPSKMQGDIFGDIDPFTAKKQIACSPVSSLPAVNVKKENTTCDFDDIDPFKSKTQIANSPVVTKLTFGEGQGTVNTGLDKQSDKSLEDSVKKSEKVDNGSADVLENFENIDPFETHNKMGNSPQLKNSSVEEQSGKSKAENTASVDVFDPFELTLQIPTSPSVEEQSGKSTAENTASVDVLDPFELTLQIPTSPSQEEGEELNTVYEVQGVTRRGDQTNKAAAKNLQGLDIDESQFVPATQVFNDPGVWDMLEQFASAPANNSQESALARMSLYVKFDPLVTESQAPVNPRRISIRPKQLELMKEIGIDETLLLLGTPPKRRPQSTSRQSAVFLSERRKEQQGTAQPGAVDILLALNPEPQKVDADDETCQKSPTALAEDVETAAGDGLFEELKYTDSDLRKFSTNLKLEYQGHVISKQQEWCRKEEDMKSVIRQKEKIIRDKEKIIREQEEDKNRMGTAFNMYEELILQLSAEKDSAKMEAEQLKNEIEQAQNDEKSMENALSDVHRRYEKMKGILEGFKKNEDILKAALAESHDKQKKITEILSTLKKTAEAKLSAVGQENEKLKHQKDAEHEKSNAQVKILTMKVDTLEKTLEQKTEQVKQLTEICDNLLATTTQ